MAKTALRKQWQELFNKDAPKRLRKEIMLRILAYRIQEEAYGGLNPKIRKRLHQIASSMSSNPKAAIADTARAKPGTRLIRSWQGKTHTVTIEESGYQYQGRRYRSLSEIARLITGTRWSGPLFFGLKAGASKGTGAANGR
ncbi:MAG: DUF2924 domain-containing protein [Acidobacteriia bacterium]|nr:DUF2924 domain-containing protein [Terriglobia bacterium]